MSTLLTIKMHDLGEGVPGSIPAEKLLEGSPTTTSWEQDRIAGMVRTGIWEMTPGMNRSIKGDTYEYCHILEGIVEITVEGGTPRRYVPGDHFVMKPGFVGTWRTVETVRKAYVIVG